MTLQDINASVQRLGRLGAALRAHPESRFACYSARSEMAASHLQLEQETARVARALAHLGIGAGSRVGLLGQNSYAWAVTDLALLRLGATVIAMHVHAFASPAASVLAQYGVAWLIADEALLGTGGPERISFNALHACANELAASEVPLQDQPLSADAVLSVNFTSGTTGEPKAVPVSCHAAADFVRFVEHAAGLSSSDCILNFLPMSVYSQRLLTVAGLLSGANVAFCSPSDVMTAIRRFRPTIMQAVPHFYESLLRAVSVEQDHARHAQQLRAVLGGRTRYLLTGSAPVPRELIEQYEACGLRLYEGYGSNETGLIAFNTPSAYRAGSVGRLVPGKEVQLDDESQILVRGEHCWGTGYLGAEAATNALVFREDGFIATGDTGSFDADGYLYVTGRIKEVINLSNGFKIHPAKLEGLLTAHAPVLQAAVLGHGRPALAAVLVRAPGATAADLDGAVASVNSALPPHFRISAYVTAEEPFSVNNGLLSNREKLQRAAVDARYGAAVGRLYNTHQT